MNIRLRFCFIISILLVGQDSIAQIGIKDFFEIYWYGLSDHPFKLNSKNREDTSKWTITNKYKNSIWGNSTYVAVAATFSKSREFEVSIGRAKCIRTYYGRGMGYANAGSWGLSFFSRDNLKAENIGGKVFLEYDHSSYWLLGSFVLRADYSYNFTNKHQYLTPSVGISIANLDILYNYSIPLNYKGDENYYKSGLTLRLKHLIGRGNCETNRVVR